MARKMRTIVAVALLSLACVVCNLASAEVNPAESVICYAKRLKKGRCKAPVPSSLRPRQRGGSLQKPVSLDRCCRKRGDGAVAGNFYAQYLDFQSNDRPTCHRCPPSRDGQWGEWTEWSFCSQSCGREGKQSRGRKCSSPSPFLDGALCISGTDGTRQLGEEERRDCNRRACPVDGGWSEWSPFGECTGKCGDKGSRVATRTCSNPVPQSGGKSCIGENERSEPCDIPPCSHENEWGRWGKFSACSAKCGQGTKVRNRPCLKRNADNSFSCMGAFREMHYCVGACDNNDIDCDSGSATDGNTDSNAGDKGSGSGEIGEGSGGGGSGGRRRPKGNGQFDKCCKRHRLAYNGHGRCCPECPEDDDDCSSSGAASSGSGAVGAVGSGAGAMVSGVACRPIKGWGQRNVLQELLKEVRSALPAPAVVSRGKRHPEHVDEEFLDDDNVVTSAVK